MASQPNQPLLKWHMLWSQHSLQTHLAVLGYILDLMSTAKRTVESLSEFVKIAFVLALQRWATMDSKLEHLLFMAFPLSAVIILGINERTLRIYSFEKINGDGNNWLGAVNDEARDEISFSFTYSLILMWAFDLRWVFACKHVRSVIYCIILGFLSLHLCI